MGYLSLDSNERSGYQARELKSVYVDSVTLLLKVVFNKCHLNKHNLYN
jgi:centrosomal protein CEP104